MNRPYSPHERRALRYTGEGPPRELVQVAARGRWSRQIAFQAFRWPDGTTHTVQCRLVLVDTVELRRSLGITIPEDALPCA